MGRSLGFVAGTLAAATAYSLAQGRMAADARAVASVLAASRAHIESALPADLRAASRAASDAAWHINSAKDAWNGIVRAAARAFSSDQ
ncbi:hypothetical protein HK105_207972 [Polyrhizophydium stewartii]|uniref:MICOS complex subunit MIC12 n=1 Tax=Polyrhizophydium stewartii TaxID=2732419 RepID=A0ABR4MZB8_9FUNG